MTLPPDFWTKPQPGLQAGIFVGWTVAVALWLYFFGTAYWKAPFLTLLLKGKFPAKNFGYVMIFTIMIAIGLAIGATVGSLIGFGLSQ